jgi:iron(III) transport system permease protein
MNVNVAPAIIPEPQQNGLPQNANSLRNLLNEGRSQVFWLLLALLLAVLVLIPILPLQQSAWSNGAAGMRRAFELSGVEKLLQTTLVLGFGTLVVALLMGTALALCTWSMTPRQRSVFEFLPVVPMIIPGVAHVVGFVFLLSPENGYINKFLRIFPLFAGDAGPINVYSLPWIIFYAGTHMAAFVYLFVYTGLKNLGSDYALAARVNGAGEVRTLFTITLPMLRPTFVYASVVVLLLSLGQFTGPLLLGRRQAIDTITTKMFDVTNDYPVDFALAAALGFPLLVLAIVLVLFQRKAIGNQSRFVGHGAESIDHRIQSQAVSVAASFVVSAYLLIAAILPILALIFVAFSPFWSGVIDFSKLTLVHFNEVFADTQIRRAIVTTLLVSIVGVLLVLPVGMLIALGIYNRQKLWGPLPALLDFLANLPLSVPAALLGFGFLFAFTSPLFKIYGTQFSLILAYMTIMIPYSVRYQLASLISLGRDTLEASQVAGAGPFRTFFQVILPLARGGIVSSAAIMFVLLVHEFGVSVLLRAPNTSVLSVILYDQYHGGSYPKVAVIALIMTLITGFGVALAMFFGGRKALEKL